MIAALSAAAVLAGTIYATPPLPPPPPPSTPPLDLGRRLPPQSNYSYPDHPLGLVFTPVPRRNESNSPAYDDPLGDVWEMEEVAGWRAVWLRRGKTRLFDAYWTHPRGERVRATLEMWINGHEVIVARRHEDGQYCRYDGVILPDWVRVQGHYTCTWERTPMPWRAQIVRMPDVLPAVLRTPGQYRR